MNTLILTGYLEDQIIGSGLILSRNADADITTVAIGFLPNKLAEVAKNNQYDKIFIVGFKLYYQDIEKILKKLKKQKVEIIWTISRYWSFKFNLFAKYASFNPYKKGDLCASIAKVIQVPENNPVLKRNMFLEKNIDNIQYRFANHIKLIDIVKSRDRRLHDNSTMQKMFQFFTLAETPAINQFAKFAEVIEEWDKFGSRELKGGSSAIDKIRRKSELIGKESNCSVLILGETGTGKETVANLIHGYSNRMNKSFTAINCAVLSPELQHSQLFGHKKGSFTGATDDYDGLFKNADGGTIFLDELAELAPQVQSGLLRVLQDGTFSPLGGLNEEIKVNVRIIAATNENLTERINAKEFRSDLFYRIAGSIINIPPLRERKEDIRPLIENILHRTKETGILTDQHYLELQNYNWPGNVRELENIIQRAKIEYFDSYNKKVKENAFTELITEQKDLFASSAEIEESEKLKDAMHNHILKIYNKYKGKLPQKKIAKDILGIAENTMKKAIN